MSDNKLAHPSLDQLAAFGQGRLSEVEIAALSGHISECPECLATIEASGDDTLISLLKAADTADDLPAPKPAEAETLAPVGEVSAVADLPAELARHGRYRIQELLGVGGMGAVYKAEHLLMERPVALKLISLSLTNNSAMVERFRREVKTAGQLRHPNIVMAYDAEQAGDSHFLVMEYVEGKSLARVVSEQGPLPVPAACDYIRQAASGLAYAHERGMVHRDIKPQNLMLTPDGQVKILDFGLARFAMESAPEPLAALRTEGAAGASLTQAGAVMGTPDYIAPEQARDAHTADIRADIYSLGCTLYDLLAGHAPFPGGTVIEKLMAHVERSPKPLTEVRPDVPPALARVVERMMAKDPAKRYQTPAEVADALRPFAAPRKPRRPRWQLVGFALLGAAAVILGGWIIYVQTDKGELIIETNDKNFETLVNNNGVTIRDKKSGRQYVLKLGAQDVRTGEYDIISELPDGVEIVHGNKFAVSRGGNTQVTVRARPRSERSPTDRDAQVAAATDAAGNWLGLVDDGQYAQSWDQSSEVSRKAVGKNDYVQIYQQLYAMHGSLKSRRLLGVEPHLSSSGGHVVIKYKTSFANVKDIVEEMFASRDRDGQWRVSGYWRRGDVLESTNADKTKVAAATRAADAWLALLDAGEFARAWGEGLAAWARERARKEEVVKVYEQLAQQSGQLKSRTLVDTHFLTRVPGAPEGEIAQFVYRSRFAHFDPAIEQIALYHDKDGQWRIVGYGRFLAKGMALPPHADSLEVPAYVGPNQARFVIPVAEKKEWSWYLPTTPANEEEYRWTVKVTSGGNTYGLGFSLYKMGGRQPASGTLQELLNAGQANVWAVTKDGGAGAMTGVRVHAEGNKVVITIDDKELLARLFSSHPSTVEFESGLPGEKVTTKSVALFYDEVLAAANAPAERGEEIITAHPRLVKTIENDSPIRALGFANDNSLVVATANSLTAFDPVTGNSQFQEKLKSWVTSPLSISKDGRIVAFAYRGSVVVFDLANGKRIKEIPIKFEGHDTDVYHLALSPNADVVVYVQVDALLFHDLKTGKTRKKEKEKGEFRGGVGLRFTPDGRHLVSASQFLSVLDPKTLGVFAEKLDVKTDTLADISKDSKRLAIRTPIDRKTGKEGFKVFSLPQLELVYEKTELPSRVWSMVLSPGGKYLALGLVNGEVEVWDLDQKKTVASWDACHTGDDTWILIAFSPDGKRLATGYGKRFVAGDGKTVKIWDLTPPK